MRNKWWIVLALLLVLPGLLSTVSCAKKTVKSDTMSQQAADEAAAAEKARKEREEAARQEALAKQKNEEMERQRAMEAEQLAEENARREAMSARNQFLNEDIYFEFDSSALLSTAQEVLKRKADWLRDNPDARVTVEGHCDERGTNEYNLALGDRRAQSVKTFLQDLGIGSERVSTISYGEERPVDTGNNEEAWAKNRRAHFVIE